MAFGGVGLSPGDFYFIVRLLGLVIESFRDGPNSAVQQYSNFAAEFEIVTDHLNRLPEENTKLQSLWEDTKRACENFLRKYALLIKVDNKPIREADRGWLRFRRQGNIVLDKAQWPLGGRDDANALQSRMVRLVHYATLDMIKSGRKIQKENYQSLENLLKDFMQQHEENIDETHERLGDLQTDLREVKDRIIPNEVTQQSEKLLQRIENIRHHQAILYLQEHSQDGSKDPIPVDGDINLPYAWLTKKRSITDLSSSQAIDHLFDIEAIFANLMKTLKKNGAPSWNAGSIIAVLDDICGTINQAFVGLGYLKISSEIKPANENRNEESPESGAGQQTLLPIVFENWTTFMIKAQNQCERARIAGPFTATRNRPTLPPIHEGSSPSLLMIPDYQKGVRSRIKNKSPTSPTGSRPAPRRYSSSEKSTPSTSSSIERAAQVIIFNDSLKEDALSQALTSCYVTVKLSNTSNTITIEARNKELKVKAKHHIRERRARVTNDDYHFESTLEKLRVVDREQNTDEPPMRHKDPKVPVYVFENKKESLEFQTEILGRKVIFSAEFERIYHIQEGLETCALQMLFVLNEYTTGNTTIYYWSQDCLFTKESGFIEWDRLEFEKVGPKSKEPTHAILTFAEEPKEPKKPKERRPSSDSKSPSEGRHASIVKAIRRMSQKELESPQSSRKDSLSSSTTTPDYEDYLERPGVTRTDTAISNTNRDMFLEYFS